VECLNWPPVLEPDSSGINKSRFISFQIPPVQVGETAIRIQLTSLHHVVPVYHEPEIPYTAFEGKSVWVESSRYLCRVVIGGDTIYGLVHAV
jgi:hypothetical protein